MEGTRADVIQNTDAVLHDGCRILLLIIYTTHCMNTSNACIVFSRSNIMIDETGLWLYIWLVRKLVVGKMGLA